MSSHRNDSSSMAVVAMATRETVVETYRPLRPKAQAENKMKMAAKGSRKRTDRAASLVDGSTRRISRQPKALMEFGI